MCTQNCRRKKQTKKHKTPNVSFDRWGFNNKTPAKVYEGEEKRNTTRFFFKGPWDLIFLQATLPALVCFSIRYCKPQEKRAGAND